MAMKNQLWKLAAGASLGVVLLSGCAGGTSPGTSQAPTTTAATSATMPATTSASLSTASSSLGTIVVNGQGMTAYVFDKDTASSGKSACTGPCATLWPAITSSSATPSVSGVTGKVATITLPSGIKQVTLNGLPLYTFSADAKAGDVNGQGYGGIWWVVGPDGNKIAAVQSTTSGSGNGGY